MEFSEPITFPVIPEGRLGYHLDREVNDFPGEEWRDVKDFEGYYQVSNLGRMKSIRCGRVKILGQYELHNRACAHLYSRTDQAKKRIYNMPLSRTVYTSFVGDIPDEHWITHRNGMSTDNSVGNLMCVSYVKCFEYNVELGKYDNASVGLVKAAARHNASKQLVYVDQSGEYPGQYTLSELKKLVGKNRATTIASLLHQLEIGLFKNTRLTWRRKEIEL